MDVKGKAVAEAEAEIKVKKGRGGLFTFVDLATQLLALPTRQARRARLSTVMREVALRYRLSIFVLPCPDYAIRENRRGGRMRDNEREVKEGSKKNLKGVVVIGVVGGCELREGGRPTGWDDDISRARKRSLARSLVTG